MLCVGLLCLLSSRFDLRGLSRLVGDDWDVEIIRKGHNRAARNKKQSGTVQILVQYGAEASEALLRSLATTGSA